MSNEKTLVAQMTEFAERFVDKEGWAPSWDELNDVEFRRSLSAAMWGAGYGQLSVDDGIYEIRFYSGTAGFFDVMVERWSRGVGMMRVRHRISVRELEV